MQLLKKMKVVEEITLEDEQDFHDEFGFLAFSEDENDMFVGSRKVKLNKPMQGDVKKFKVYVKNDKGNVVKVNFGDSNMRSKSQKCKKKIFKRHNCDNQDQKQKHVRSSM